MHYNFKKIYACKLGFKKKKKTEKIQILYQHSKMKRLIKKKLNSLVNVNLTHFHNLTGLI